MNIIEKMKRSGRMHQLFSENKIIFVVFLLIQNIAIFWGHYFNNIGFPGDFPQAYYDWPAFWTTSISMGIFPQWIPYVAMGYPLAINTQSGLYYPIFWIFPLLHLPFTLHAAVLVQVLHVFFGSIGMFLLLNLIFRSSRYAFVGAVAFQFFGGFYSNAEHADIIRAFAIAPWLFYVFKLNVDKPKITRRILFIPIAIYFLATGGYPGNVLSSLFIISVFLCLEIFHGYLKARRTALKVGAAMVGLLILGISLSIVHLGPSWQERNQLTRIIHPTTEFNGLWAGEIPAFFMSSRPMSGEPSMTSTFVTLPLLVFASFIRISTIKKYWTFIAVLVLSILMVGGPNSPFWQIITSAVPALKLSRFPSSDYRVFVAIPLIILGVAGLKAIIERGLSWKEFLIRAAFVITWFSVGAYSLYSHVQNNVNFFYYSNPAPLYHLFANFQVTLAVFILFATILFIVYYLKRNKKLQRISAVNKPIILSGLSLMIVVLLVLSDGFRVISDMQTWNVKPFNAAYISNTIPLEKNGKLITYSIFENIPIERPARYGNATNLPFIGYLLGGYTMQEPGGTILEGRSIVESNNIYRQYMLMKWLPLLLVPNFTNSTQHTSITLPASTFLNIVKQKVQAIQPDLHSYNQSATTPNQVVQTRYGINDISYKVNLKEPKLMVENEIYFPGWQADLIFPNKVVKLQASDVNDVFRAWLLPAGNYIMVAHFNFPNLIIYQSIAAVSLGVWIFIIARYWRRPQLGSNKVVPRY